WRSGPGSVLDWSRIVIAHGGPPTRSVAQTRSGATRKQATLLGGPPWATAAQRADFGAKRRCASVTMIHHRSVLAPGLAPESAPSRPGSSQVRTREVGAMYDFAADPALPKPELYRQLCAAADALTAGERDGIANMANVAALIWEFVPRLNWSGFYRMVED